MRKSPTVLLACAALVAACSSPSDSTPSASSPVPTPAADDRGGVPTGYPLDVDVVAPLVITTLGPEPIPVTGTDGKVHVAYELSVLNSGLRPATITRVETLADGPEGAVVATVDQKEIVGRTILIPNLLPAPVTEIPAGRTAVLVLDDAYATRADVPAAVAHRFTVTLGEALPEYRPVSARYPNSVTQIGGEVRTSAASPVVIGPPLAGDDWLAANACCVVSTHRGAVMGFGGRLNGSERYAIDWLRFDPTEVPLTTHRGDGTRNADYLAYDAPLLAVADGTIVAVVSDGSKEATPQKITPDQALEGLGGNYVIIDIGDGNFAFYAHMVPGSATVKTGDQVARGQVIGRLGNSGNTTEAHLHFHVMRAPVPLSSDNVPFEIDRFTLVGTVDGERFVPDATPGERTNQLPLASDVIDFPAAA